MVAVTLTREQWATIFEDASPPSFGELVTALDGRDFTDEDPTALINEGIESGLLAEDQDAAGALTVYTLSLTVQMTVETRSCRRYPYSERGRVRYTVTGCQRVV